MKHPSTVQTENVMITMHSYRVVQIGKGSLEDWKWTDGMDGGQACCSQKQGMSPTTKKDHPCGVLI